VSPWVEPGSVYNEEFRHTSLIATVRKQWNLGDALSQRDASARTFDHVFSRNEPRDPREWAAFKAQPVPAWTMDEEAVGNALSTLGKTAAPGLIERARELGVSLPPQLDDPSVQLTGELVIEVLRDISWHFFPLLSRGHESRVSSGR
jgi:phospholipase C